MYLKSNDAQEGGHVKR